MFRRFRLADTELRYRLSCASLGDIARLHDGALQVLA
jgi:hypothetical protein